MKLREIWESTERTALRFKSERWRLSVLDNFWPGQRLKILELLTEPKTLWDKKCYWHHLLDTQPVGTSPPLQWWMWAGQLTIDALTGLPWPGQSRAFSHNDSSCGIFVTDSPTCWRDTWSNPQVWFWIWSEHEMRAGQSPEIWVVHYRW